MVLGLVLVLSPLLFNVGEIQSELIKFEKHDWSTLLADPQFSQTSLIKPRLYHSLTKREIYSTKVDKERLEHVQHFSVEFEIKGKNQILELILNRDLTPKEYFEKWQHNGSYSIRRPGVKAELCHYQGKLKGIQDSWAAVSTCHGFRGVVFDGSELHYIERASDSLQIHESDHYLYSHSDLVSNFTCGHQENDALLENGIFDKTNSVNNRRFKRSEKLVRGPYNANERSRYVELMLVIDNNEYKALGENMERVNAHCKDIVNIINALYMPLNIFIALVGVEVWSEKDEIPISTIGDITLTNFLLYRKENLIKDHPNDYAHLLTKTQFEGGTVGKAFKGPICTFEFSGGITVDHSTVVGIAATNVAHQLGHVFGMEHDSDQCRCSQDRCIMARTLSFVSPTKWSSCSLESLAVAFGHGMDYCLRNKPTSLYGSPVCGNGFVEEGEQCDCGLKDYCNNPCCNANTCTLFTNASCATGECCDLTTCQPKIARTLCRKANEECDLPEFCTGQSEFCPDDVFKMDGSACGNDQAYCYKGTCRTHTDQCKLLWGPSGNNSDAQCYTMNKRGTRYGNCGYNRLNQSYIKCDNPDLLCGLLQCSHLNDKLEFGLESVAILSHSFINRMGIKIPCRKAIVDLGLDMIDPGMVPNGAKCGEGKMCVNQKCITVETMRAKHNVFQCPNNCSGQGICDSQGHCQ